jgi:hypothetical protein
MVVWATARNTSNVLITVMKVNRKSLIEFAEEKCTVA